MLNHPLKLGDLKNLLYKPTQSPLMPDVNWGPAVSNDAKKLSGLNGNGAGAAYKPECNIPVNDDEIKFRFYLERRNIFLQRHQTRYVPF